MSQVTEYLVAIGVAAVFLVALSIFQVFWNKFWGNHDE